MNDDNVLHLLGEINGKLDQALAAAKEHREDDTRRFTELYQWQGRQDEEINKAKGAKSVIVWAVGLVAGGIGALVTAAVRIKGGG